MVAEDRLDVAVTRDDPVADGGAVEDGLLAAGLGEQGKGVAQVEWVEGGAEVVVRAVAPFAQSLL